MANENNSNKTKKILLDSEYLKSIIDEEEDFVDNDDNIVNPDKETTMNIQLAGETLNINASSIQDALVSCFQSTYKPVEVPKTDSGDYGIKYQDRDVEDSSPSTIRYNKDRVSYVKMNKLKHDMNIKEVNSKNNKEFFDYKPNFNFSFDYKKIILCIIVGTIGISSIYFVSKIDFKEISFFDIDKIIANNTSNNYFYDNKIKSDDISKIEAVILEHYEDMKKNPITIVVEDNNYELDITRFVSKEKIKEFSKQVALSKDNKFTFADIVFSEDIKIIINEIYNKYCTESSEPKFEINNGIVTIKDGVSGKVFDKEKLYDKVFETLKTYDSNNFKIKIDLVEKNPVMTAKSLQNINSVISENSTIILSTLSSNELKNISDRINNTVINQNDTFSLLDTLGSYNLSSEYLSQIATGIYNAQLKLGIKPVQKTNNSIEGVYAPKGLDVFVDKDNDYKFKNTFKEPIAISTSVKDNILNVKLLSNKSILDNRVYKPIVEKVADKEYVTYLEVYNTEDKLFEKKLDKILIDTSIYK